ncbi:MAG: carboxylating nicotinate-nucleotide diphosphorylase [Planctomycetota bacterium]
MEWQRFDALLDEALAEDRADHDVTTLALIAPARRTEGRVVAREAGVVCGLPLAERLAHRFDEELEFEARAREGERVDQGAVVAELSGLAVSVLALERPMLNFLQRLSGVATLTARFVQKVAHTSARIYDTRKTTPGWRHLEKYAVRCGGGCNHRMDLGEMVLMKDNHLRLLAGAEAEDGPARTAVRRAREEWPGLAVEVEVETEDQLRDVLAAAPDIVMLDNMSPEQVAAAVEAVENRSSTLPRPEIEASGGIDLSNVADYAEAGVDRIALGEITHSAPALDISVTVGSEA